MTDAAPENPPATDRPGEPGNTAGEQFQPGRSGNPGGRPKGLARKVREILGDDDGETLARFMAAVMSGEVVTVTTDPTGKRVEERTRAAVKERIEAAKWLGERGWGKPPAFAPVEDDDPLGMSQAAAAEAARSLDERIDEVARKRLEREQAEVPPGPAE